MVKLGVFLEMISQRNDSYYSMKQSNAADDLYWLIKVLRLPLPEREYRFHKDRRWRFDLAWPQLKIAFEVEGGIWLKRGGHTTGVGYSANMEKYNAATLLGWAVYRVTPAHIKDGYARGLIEKAL